MRKGGETVDRVNKTPLMHSCMSAYSRLGNVDLSLEIPAVLLLALLPLRDGARLGLLCWVGLRESKYLS